MEIHYKIIDFLRNLTYISRPKAPYKHVVQLGDPVLRYKCRPVEKEELQRPEMKRLLGQMKKVVKRYKCVGVSAPQVGVDLRVFAMNFPDVKNYFGTPEEYRLKEMKAYPYTVWINPSMKVLDYTKVTFAESCESMRGFCADVPRYPAIRLSGWDENGAERTEELSGWMARIAQHEMDHIEGQLFLDRADMSSLACTFWDKVNTKGGRIYMSYYPNKMFSKC